MRSQRRLPKRPLRSHARRIANCSRAKRKTPSWPRPSRPWNGAQAGTRRTLNSWRVDFGRWNTRASNGPATRCRVCRNPAIELDLDADILRLELALDNGAIAACYWPLDDIHREAIAVTFAALDGEDGYLRISFILRGGDSDCQRWSFDRLRGFVSVRGAEQAMPARVLLQ